MSKVGILIERFNMHRINRVNQNYANSSWHFILIILTIKLMVSCSILIAIEWYFDIYK